MLNMRVFLCSLFLLMGAFGASGKVILIANNVSFPFEDSEANFAPSVKGFGISGALYIAEPLNGCAPLTNKIVRKLNDTKSAFVLMIRGECSFEDKVRRAQYAGFNASIIYDNQIDDKLVSMGGNSAGINIPAVFVSKESGETFAKFASDTDIEMCILPSFEFSAWAIMSISFISLLALSAVLATCFFVRRHRIRRERPRASRVREFHGMSGRLVKAMPSLVFTAVSEDNTTSRACAICLEDYSMGDKLRVLPCRHKFHSLCVDAWLTSWRTFCPVCKRDARTDVGEPPASESTPLLSSSSFSDSNSALSSFRSSIASSSAIQIVPSSSRPQSISNTPNNYSFRSHAQSPHLRESQTSVDLRNMSSQLSNAAYLVSSHSLGYPRLSPLNSRYTSPYIPSPGNGSSSYIGSSSRRANALHYSESAASFSPFASTHSLPEC